MNFQVHAAPQSWLKYTVVVKPVSNGSCYLSFQEKALPGVVMASGGRYFTMLYQLASLNDSRILQGIRRLIHLIPTDPTVSESLDAISYHSTKQPLASADASPKLSPRSKKVIPDNLEEAKKQLAELFDASAEGMSAFRVLYNLEVLSGKLLPTKSEAVPKFSHDFLEAGGLRVILDVFQHDALPVDVNCDVRQSIYLVRLLRPYSQNNLHKFLDFLSHFKYSNYLNTGLVCCSNVEMLSVGAWCRF